MIADNRINQSVRPPMAEHNTTWYDCVCGIARGVDSIVPIHVWYIMADTLSWKGAEADMNRTLYLHCMIRPIDTVDHDLILNRKQTKTTEWSNACGDKISSNVFNAVQPTLPTHSIFRCKNLYSSHTPSRGNARHNDRRIHDRKLTKIRTLTWDQR